MSAAGRVLIVDDEPALAAALRELLELDGIAVQMEQSLITLPFALRRFDPDLILIDMSMAALPASAYFEARRRKGVAGPPAALYSGRSRRELSRLAEELGADGCISKADHLDDALLRIRSLIAHGRALKAIREETDDIPRSASAAAYGPENAQRDRHRVA